MMLWRVSAAQDGPDKSFYIRLPVRARSALGSYDFTVPFVQEWLASEDLVRELQVLVSRRWDTDGKVVAIFKILILGLDESPRSTGRELGGSQLCRI